MLTNEDLKQIGALLVENNKVLKSDIVGDVGEMLEQDILPEIEKVRVGLEDVKTELKDVKTRLITVETTMVTKDYLDEKLANTRGDLVAYDRKLESKTDALIGTLERNKVLAPADVAALEAVRVFPKSPTT